MPLHGLDGLPKEIQELIEKQLSAQDKRSLEIAREFSGPIDRKTNAIREVLKDLDLVRDLRNRFQAERKALRLKKMQALLKDSKLHKAFSEMKDKADQKKLLDSIGDDFEKGQLAMLKKQIASVDTEIKEVHEAFKRALEALNALKATQKAMATV